MPPKLYRVANSPLYLSYFPNLQQMIFDYKSKASHWLWRMLFPRPYFTIIWAIVTKLIFKRLLLRNWLVLNELIKCTNMHKKSSISRIIDNSVKFNIYSSEIFLLGTETLKEYLIQKRKWFSLIKLIDYYLKSYIWNRFFIAITINHHLNQIMSNFDSQDSLYDRKEV